MKPGHREPNLTTRSNAAEARLKWRKIRSRACCSGVPYLWAKMVAGFLFLYHAVRALISVAIVNAPVSIARIFDAFFAFLHHPFDGVSIGESRLPSHKEFSRT